MALLASSIKYYIVSRIGSDPAWKAVKVIFSDANVPGEGEHKIVEYIRKQRLDPNYDAATKHVIYGLDADLIMLSMATHEPNFMVLREDVFWEEQRKYNVCSHCDQKGHMPESCPERAKTDPSFRPAPPQEQPFIFLNVAILREYLEVELQPAALSSPDGQAAASPSAEPWNLERAIDDWIFLCFFVGNDFLPHLPSLEIREGAIDLLIDIYKSNASALGGYICTNGSVDVARVQVILNHLGAVEDEIFRKRHEKESRRDYHQKRRKAEEEEREQALAAKNAAAVRQREAIAILLDQSGSILPVNDASLTDPHGNRSIVQGRREMNIAAAQALRAQLATQSPTDSAMSSASTAPSTMSSIASSAPADGAAKSSNKRSHQEATKEADEVVDTVRLWEGGAKERYYAEKFHSAPDNAALIADISRAYIEGLCWVMQYYYQGCPSWKWFYPYHFAPFASDMKDIASLDISFELGEPFRPFDQLMGVFPADSRMLVPEPFRQLMTDASSEIFDFYPTDFAIDLNGKKQAWHGVVLLPFIDEERLLTALEAVYPLVSDEELLLNRPGFDRIYLHVGEASKVMSQVNSAPTPTGLDARKAILPLLDRSMVVPMDPLQCGGIAGSLARLPKDSTGPPSPGRGSKAGSGALVDDRRSILGETYKSPLANSSCPDLVGNVSVECLIYLLPYYERRNIVHRSALLPAATRPSKVLTSEDAHLIQSGTASRRLPGRLILDGGSAFSGQRNHGGSGRGNSYGSHSMHRDYSRSHEEPRGRYEEPRGRYEEPRGGRYEESRGGRYEESRGRPEPRSSYHGSGSSPYDSRRREGHQQRSSDSSASHGRSEYRSSMRYERHNDYGHAQGPAMAGPTAHSAHGAYSLAPPPSPAVPSSYGIGPSPYEMYPPPDPTISLHQQAAMPPPPIFPMMMQQQPVMSMFHRGPPPPPRQSHQSNNYPPPPSSGQHGDATHRSAYRQ